MNKQSGRGVSAMKGLSVVLVLLSLLYVWSSRLGIDGYELEYLLSADNLVRNGSFYMSVEPSGVPGVPERSPDIPLLPRHNLLQVFLTAPLVVAGMPFNRLFTSAASGITALPVGSLIAVSLLNPLLTIASVILLYLIGRELGFRESACLTMSVLYGAATMAWPYAVIGMEPLQTAMMLLSILYCIRLKKQVCFKHTCLLALSLAALMHTKISAPLVALPIAAGGLILLLRQWKKHAVLMVIHISILAVAGGIWFGLYQVRKQGFYAPGFFSSFKLFLIPQNIAGMLISPGKSLFVYNPLLFWCLADIPGFFRKHRFMSLIMTGVVAGTLILTACWDWALVEESWGPRYLMPLIPIAMIMGTGSFDPAVLKRNRVRFCVFVLLVMVSVFVQFPGVVYSNASMMRSVQNRDIAIVDLTVWTPVLSPIPVGWHLISNGLRSAADIPVKPWRWYYYGGLVGQGAKPVVVDFDTTQWNHPYPALFIITRHMQRTGRISSADYLNPNRVFPVWMLVTIGLLTGVAAVLRRHPP